MEGMGWFRHGGWRAIGRDGGLRLAVGAMTEYYLPGWGTADSLLITSPITLMSNLWASFAMVPFFAMRIHAATTIQFSSPSYEVTEGGAVMIRVTATPPPAEMVVFYVTPAGGTGSPIEFSIPDTGFRWGMLPGKSFFEFGIYPPDDSVAESDETLKFKLSIALGDAVLGGQQEAELTVHDAGRKVGFTQVAPAIEGGFLVIQGTRVGNVSQPLRVEFATGAAGSAVPGIDFAPRTNHLDFLAGERQKSFNVLSLPRDGAVESAKTVELRFTGVSDATTLVTTQLMAVVHDRELPTSADVSFRPEFDRAGATGVAPDGGIITVATTRVGSTEVRRLVRLNRDGSIDPGFVSSIPANAQINRLRVLSNGFILVAGTFPGQVTRLFANGRIDPSYKPDAATLVEVGGSGAVRATFLESGAVLFGPTSAAGLRRLLPDGTRDNDFNQKSSAALGAVASGQWIWRVVEQPDGRLLISTLPGGNSPNHWWRLMADGTRDESFQMAGTGGEILPLASGSLIWSWNTPVTDPVFKFVRVDAGIQRLRADGTKDPGFDAGGLPLLGGLRAVAEIDSRVYVTIASSLGETETLVRLLPDGQIDPGFTEARFSGGGAGTRLESVLPHGDGLICSGDPVELQTFSVVNGSSRPNLARILTGSVPTRSYSMRVLSGPGGTNPVTEGSGDVVIQLTRAGDLNGVSNVRYATREGTAHEGVHYQRAAGTIAFAAYELTKTFSVPLLDNASFDGRPRFTTAIEAVSSASETVEPPLPVDIIENELGIEPDSLRLGEGGAASFIVTGLGTQSGHVVERSADLNEWTPIQTIPAGYGNRRLVESIDGGTGRAWFRVRRE